MRKSVEEQMKIIMKGADTVVNREELEAKLLKAEKENRPLIIKLGLDPSAPDIHLGHAVVLRKMRQMQDLGHKVVIIIGDFTGRIGDPTGKAKGRSALSKEQVEENALTYQTQILKVLDSKKMEIHRNSEWLSELKFQDILELAASTTVARILERDDFQNRYRNNQPIGVHEFFYPLMQAYDSIAIKADLELGGTDQTFNILMGRSLQKTMGVEQQVAMFMPILEGLDGIEKMSKSLGNYIGVQEEASVMFKKVMEVPDSLILKYFNLATDEHPDRIAELEKEMEQGRNPKDVKYELARAITALYHTETETREAMEYYEAAFSKKAVPDQIPELVIEWDKDCLLDLIPLLTKLNFVSSNSEFRRLVNQGGVRINGEVTHDIQTVLACNDVLKIGKKKFLKIIK